MDAVYKVTSEDLPCNPRNSTQCSVVDLMGRKSKKEGTVVYLDFPGGSAVKNPPAMQEPLEMHTGSLG